MLWFAVLLFGSYLVSILSGVQISGRKFWIFDLEAKQKLRDHAYSAAKASCSQDASKVQGSTSSIAMLSQLLLRPSTFDDSEEQVARRLAGAFFLMGYVPLSFDRQGRALMFTDGEERILVRFRHRTGIATNISYVEKLVAGMAEQDIERGFLFCSPGLSGNAAEYARKKKVKWYTLESMNVWIEQVLTSEHTGPDGDVLQNLDKLLRFLGHISPRFTRRA